MEDFREIVFGRTDAQTESEEYPNLLIDGYLNTTNIVGNATNKTTFLFMGYKGSGKSALSEHLKLSYRDGIVKQVPLKDFPYNSLGNILTGEAEKEVKLKIAWRWLLLTYALSILMDDTAAKCELQQEFDDAIKLLTQTGLFPLTNISDLVRKTNTSSFKAAMKAFSYEHTTQKESVQVSLYFAIDYIKKLIISFKEEHNHLIIIDGLDEILTTREVQYAAIAALMNEARDLNSFFLKNNITIKILLLCRTDIFERLPDPNKNKIRQDCSFSLSWYYEGLDKRRCDLVKLANLRTQMRYPEVKDLFNTFFPKQFNHEDTVTILLEYTRHTPRDFLQLLNCIQRQCKGNRVVYNDINNGLKVYSSEYFLPEIKDEMVGYIPADCIDEIINIFAVMRSHEFKYDQFASLFNKNPALAGLSIDKVLRVLYDCSAIGQRFFYKDGNNGTQSRTSFKYRNRNSTISNTDLFILHKGLRKALNVNS